MSVLWRYAVETVITCNPKLVVRSVKRSCPNIYLLALRGRDPPQKEMNKTKKKMSTVL